MTSGSLYSSCDNIAAAIELQWLSIKARIQYKLCLFVHLAINGTGNGKAPLYISNLLQPVLALPDRPIVLRSAMRSDFQVPATCLNEVWIARLQRGGPQGVERSAAAPAPHFY